MIIEVKGPGNPYWTGPPSQGRIDAIKFCAQVIGHKSQWRRYNKGGWERLLSDESFKKLNEEITRSTTPKDFSHVHSSVG